MKLLKPKASKKSLEKLLAYLGTTENYSKHYAGNRAEDFKKCFDTESPWCRMYANLVLRGMKPRSLDYKETHHVVPRCFYKCGRYDLKGLAGNSTALSFLEHVYAHYCLLRCASTDIASNLAGAFLFMAGLKKKGKRPVIPDEAGLEELLETLDLNYARSQRKDYQALEAEGRTHKCDDPLGYYRDWKTKNQDKVKASRKKYQENNANKIKANQKKYQESERGKATKKKYRETHKEQLYKSAKKWREEHAEELKVKKAAYNAEHHEENKAKHAAWYAEHKDEINLKRRLKRDDTVRAKESARNKKYYAEHREEIRKNQKEYQDAHRAEKRVLDKAYYESHKAEHAAKGKARYEANKEKILEQKKTYYEAKKAAGYRDRKDPVTGKHKWVFVGPPESPKSTKVA